MRNRERSCASNPYPDGVGFSHMKFTEQAGSNRIFSSANLIPRRKAVPMRRTGQKRVVCVAAKSDERGVMASPKPLLNLKNPVRRDRPIVDKWREITFGAIEFPVAAPALPETVDGYARARPHSIGAQP